MLDFDTLLDYGAKKKNSGPECLVSRTEQKIFFVRFSVFYNIDFDFEDFENKINTS